MVREVEEDVTDIITMQSSTRSHHVDCLLGNVCMRVIGHDKKENDIAQTC